VGGDGQCIVNGRVSVKTEASRHRRRAAAPAFSTKTRLACKTASGQAQFCRRAALQPPFSPRKRGWLAKLPGVGAQLCRRAALQRSWAGWCTAPRTWTLTGGADPMLPRALPLAHWDAGSPA
jgi:hypothetical protein